MKPDLRVAIGSLRLRNPVILASGTVGYGDEYAGLIDYSKIGAIITKGLSLRPKAGNAPPRIAEVEGGMLNSIGLENVGFDAFAGEKMPLLRRLGTAVIVNVFGASVEEYAEIARKAGGLAGVGAIEVNVSCPNVKEGGIAFGSSIRSIGAVTAAVRKRVKKPVIVKLTQAVSDIAAVAKTVEAEGADALTVINTLPAMAIDIKTGRPLLGAVTGGLSGPAIKPVAVCCVYRVAQAVKIPIIASGGVMTWEDAVEFFLAGATAVQVGTAVFGDPAAPAKIAEGIAEHFRKSGIRGEDADMRCRCGNPSVCSLPPFLEEQTRELRRRSRLPAGRHGNRKEECK